MRLENLENRLNIVVDADAEPANPDQALSRFLLAIVRREEQGGTNSMECELCGENPAEHFAETDYGQRHLCRECCQDIVDRAEQRTEEDT